METREDRTFNFAEAVAYAGVSRQRLRKAIAAGELAALGGGKPGTLLEIRERDLVRWCRQAKVILPPVRKRVRPVRIEDLQRQYEVMLAGFEDILETLRRVAATMDRTLMRMYLLDGTLGKALNVIIPALRAIEGDAMKIALRPLPAPVPNGERPERSIAQK